jgi:putative CocE/NonD family hydrolase
MRSRSRIIVWVALVLAAGAATPALAQQAEDILARYTRTNVMIPMRDGVRLNTDIYVPKNRTGPLPIIFRRTPYGVDNAWRALGTSYRELADDGYIFAFQDIRGRYRSEGQFVMQRPARDRQARANPKAIDEATDAYDTIDWLVRNVDGNNGRVGMLGVSYDGWTTAMALTDPHPALKAASPQASPADMWLGDDFHHNGAFRLSYGFEYAAMMETSKENENFSFDRYDTYDWYLALGPLSNVNAKYLHGKIPSWNDYVAHPDYDEFWKRQTLIPALTQVTVPTLNVAGWWDQEDFYGPLAIYERLEQFDRDGKNFLVVGPWNHGGWNAAEGQKLGNIDFGSATSKFYRDSVQAPFFHAFLKGDGSRRPPEAFVFESGSNRWRSYDSWPPKQSSPRSLFFLANGKLGFEPAPASQAGAARGAAARGGAAPSSGDPRSPAFDEYLSDPAHPVPYRQRPIQATYHPRGSSWYTWLTENQRFVDDRPDVASWETDPLTEDVTIAGEVMADLSAATSGSDADWIVKLIDVYPEVDSVNPRMGGYQFMISNEVFRGRYRESFERPKAIVPNAVGEYRFSLHGQSYTFQKGHRIMVQVQSTWFPIIDRNPQTFVPNIFEAKASDFRKATQRIYRAPGRQSRVVLPVVQETVP